MLNPQFWRGVVQSFVLFLLVLFLGASAASAQSAIATSDEAMKLLDTARRVNGLAVPGIHPWRIKVTFHRYDRSGNFVDQGEYELLWSGPTKTKAIYRSRSFSQVQYSSHEGTFITGDHGDPPGLLILVWWIAYSPVPDQREVTRLGATLHRQSSRGVEQDCVELGKGPAIPRYDRETDKLIDPAADSSTSPNRYCFEEHDVLTSTSQTKNGFAEKVHASFRNPVEFDHRMIARDLDLDLGGILGLTAHIENIEPLPDSSEAEFQVPPEARELGNEEQHFANFPRGAPPEVVSVPPNVAAHQLLRRVSVLYPPEAKAAGIEGTVVLKARISKSGTVESLHVVSGPKVLQQAALDAANSWVYRPYLLNGSPVEMDTTINVVFNLEKAEDEH